MCLCVYVCVYVCICVCVCVCVCQHYSPNGWSDFDENSHKQSLGYLLVSFFSFFENSNLMTSWRPFCTKPCGHSHVFNIAPIFFHILVRYSLNTCFVWYCISAKSVDNFNPKWRTAFEFGDQNGHQNQNLPFLTNEVSIYTDLDLLNLKMSILTLSDASLPVNWRKFTKLRS